ncbi:uncharacterized protein BJ171DRAFT_538091 [Polychytrium aggregatum]|uniref:uncharacterized protein n=1 Tax=Polychytrium aggregatum TaxID=110093 RepID=UPI0022FF4518|nr:uncharacterized protein BJ171DRAFT_538091 [Polychytrium aggregatum]KAI9192934.1 hypothetical protein BJ171DRAFT_538091 [Polychytrium aggregatum]
MVSWTICISVIVGALLAFQAGANSSLGNRSKSSSSAVLWSFLSGTVPCIIYWLVEIQGGQRINTLDSIGANAIPWWAWAGGPLGLYYVGAITVLAPRLGAAACLGVIVAAQLATAVILDHYGLIGLPQHTAAPGRIVGIVLSVAGVTLVMYGDSMVYRITHRHRSKASAALEQAKPVGQLDQANQADLEVQDTNAPVPELAERIDWVWSAALLTGAFLAGAALAFQAGVSGYMGTMTTPGFSALYNFVFGDVLIPIYWFFEPNGRKALNLKELITTSPWWIWIGGLIGSGYVLSITFLIPLLGAATNLGTNIVAQIIAAMVLDHLGWMGFKVQRASYVRVFGALVLLVGVVMVSAF